MYLTLTDDHGTVLERLRVCCIDANCAAAKQNGLPADAYNLDREWGARSAMDDITTAARREQNRFPTEVR